MSVQMNTDLPETDNEGYLLDPGDWDESIAEQLAAGESLQMTADRWQVVRIIRDYYEHTSCVPEFRKVLKIMKEQSGVERATRKFVYAMFPYGYGQQACKIAGMRKPLKVLLDV